MTIQGHGPWTLDAIEYLRGLIQKRKDAAAKGIMLYDLALYAHAKGAWAQDHGVEPKELSELKPGEGDPFYQYICGQISAEQLGISAMAFCTLPDDVRTYIEKD